MQPDITALVDSDDIAARSGLEPVRVREFLEARGDLPVATYHGRPLWLSDTVHDILEEPACAHG